MWNHRLESLREDRVLKFSLTRDADPIPYSEVLSLWDNDTSFRSFFIGLLADAPFSAFRWETPPVTRATADRDFEFVLLSSSFLDRPVDSSAFADHFNNADAEEVVAFPNLGGDAVMVAPRAVASKSIYGHLASFVRQAPERQIHELWQVVARAMHDRLSDRPVWLSTAGMGVSWLHIRLDSRPKYYGHAPYKLA